MNFDSLSFAPQGSELCSQKFINELIECNKLFFIMSISFEV
ncbi:hypothetical protein yfred0001_28280 [Yersinia frederiksenii ATCC 33641]|nr:hypothetical protein yfred0001_28280 [Yersinia frederiksenii ATCC 33641]